MFKDMLKYIPGQIIPGIVSFITIPLLTHLFSPEDYGEYNIVTVTSNVLMAIMSWAGMVVIRFYPVYEVKGKIAEFSSVIIKLSLISILIITGFYITAIICIREYIKPTLYTLLLISIFVFVSNAFFNVLQHFLRSRRSILLYSMSTCWKSIGTILVGLGLVNTISYKIDSFLWGMAISLVLINAYIYRKALPNIKFNNDRVIDNWDFFRYSLPLVFGNIAAWMLSLSDRYIIGYFSSSKEVGIYSAYYNIAEYSLMQLSTLFMLAAGPIMVELWEKEGEVSSQIFLNKLTRFYIILLVPCVMGISVLSANIGQIFFGTEYFEGHKIMPYIAVGTFFLGLQQRYQSGFILYKKTKYITYMTLGSAILNILLNILFVPLYGYKAAALNTMIADIVLCLAMAITSQRYLEWSFPIVSLFRSVLSSVVMIFVIIWLNDILSCNIPNLFYIIIIGVLIYFIMLLVLKEIKIKEITEMIISRG